MTKAPEQLFIAGTEPAPDANNAMIDLRLHSWLEAKEEARRITDKRKDLEQLLLVEMKEYGIEKYPYVDSVTGKKRYFVADKTPKAKTVTAHEPKVPRKKKRDVEEIAKREETEANRVESRRVPRATVAEEIGEADGFKDLRARMTETEH